MLNIRNLYSRLKKLLSGDVCGLNAKEGTIVAGLFMLMVSIMQLIFEAGHFRYLASFESTDNNDSNLYAFCIGTITFTCLTIIVVVLLFLFIWKEIFWGVAGYITWIFLYEISKICFLSILMPANNGLPSSVQALEWFGLTMRLLSHIFWMLFVTAYAIELYKINRSTDDSSKNKRKTPPKLKFAKVKELGV